MSLADQVWSEDDRRKLREAFDLVYSTIDRGEELIREGLDGPLTMAWQFKAIQAKVDEAEKLVEGLALSLWEMGEMAELMRAERDKALQEVVLAAAEGYAQGWQERFAALLEAMPETGAELIEWLSETFEGYDRADPETLAEVLAVLKAVTAAIKKRKPGELNP